MRRRRLAETYRRLAVQAPRQINDRNKTMSMDIPGWFTSKRRQWLYLVAGALLSLLVFYKVVDPEAVPLWLNVAGTVLGVGVAGTAGVATKVQRGNGTLPD